MARFRILWVEDDPPFLFRDAIEQTEATLEICPTPEKVVDFIVESRYHLVLVDAMFPPALNESLEERYALGEIVQKVRARYKQNIRIVGLTHFALKLLRENSRDLDSLDELWDKASLSPDFLYWNIQRIIKKSRRRPPDHCLVDALVESAQSPAPWPDEIRMMATRYQSRIGEVEQIRAIDASLKKIGESLGMPAEFTTLWDGFVGMELLNVAAKPAAWGHLRHVINVFWLGYILINKGVVEVDSVAEAIWPGEKIPSREERVRKVNSAWLLCSLFHDFGLFVQRLPTLFHQCNEFCNYFPFVQHASLTKDRFVIQRSECTTILSRLVGQPMSNSARDWMLKNQDLLISDLDHGFISAITLCSTFLKSSAEDIALPAAKACYFHNFAASSKMAVNSKNDASPPRLSFAKDPLATLLVLCDQIQVWDRETGQETSYRDLPIECAELSELATELGTCSLKINYTPFRYILPEELIIERTESSLRNILQSQVMAALQRLDFTAPGSPKINLSFTLCGDIDVGNWTSSR